MGEVKGLFHVGSSFIPVLAKAVYTVTIIGYEINSFFKQLDYRGLQVGYHLQNAK